MPDGLAATATARSAPVRLDILIYPDPDHPSGDAQAVLLENGSPVEWLRPPAPGAVLRQDILLGRVARIEPGLQAAFVEIGQPLAGLLPLKKAPPGLKPGQPIIVQIRRLAAAGKGHPLVSQPQLPGPFAVRDLTLSRPLRRSKLAAFPPAEQERLFQADLANLDALWLRLQAEAAAGGPVPRLLARFADPIPLALAGWPVPGLQTIQVAGADCFALAERQILAFMPHLLPLLRIHPSGSAFSLAEVFRVGDLADQVRQRRVWLDNGGFIVLDQTEALLAIDVNTGKASGKANARNPSQLHRQTNGLAAAAIARQLRLRNIVGLVVIDFIRLADSAEQAAVLAELQAGLARDRGRIELGGYTRLGLVELVRTAP